MTNKRCDLIASMPVIGLGMVVFAAIGSLLWPLADDQEIFAWEGQVILDGGAPYKDAWEIKGPLALYTYASAMWLFGRNEMSIRIFDLVTLLGGCLVLRRLVLRLNCKERFGASLAITFYALTYYGWWISTPAQPDGWGSILILLTVTLLIEKPRNPHLMLVAAGAAVALATLLKPLFLIYMALPIIFSPASPSSSKLISPRSACLLAFCSLILASMLGLLIAGAFADYMDVLKFTFSTHVPLGRSLQSLRQIWLMLNYLHLLVPLLLMPIGLWAMREMNTSREVTILATWLALTLISTVSQGWNFPYQWLPVSMALAPILGCFFSWLKLRSETGRKRSLNVGTVVASCLGLIALPFRDTLLHSYTWPEYLVGSQSREQHIKQLTVPWDYWILDRISAYVKDHSDPSDFVLVWGWDPLINVLSSRKSPTRFGYSYPLVAKGPLQSKYREIFLCEVFARPPKYIVVDAVGRWAMLNHSGVEYLQGFPMFYNFIHNGYEVVWSIGHFEVWRRTATDPHYTSSVGALVPSLSCSTSQALAAHDDANSARTVTL